MGLSCVQPPPRLHLRLCSAPADARATPDAQRRLRLDHPPARLVEGVTAALLSCRSLRRLAIPNWWLSPFPAAPAAAPASPALPHLQSLHLHVQRVLDEPALAVLLDASPHLQELIILGCRPLPYDVMVWAGDRCHELSSASAVQPHLPRRSPPVLRRTPPRPAVRSLRLLSDSLHSLPPPPRPAGSRVAGGAPGAGLEAGPADRAEEGVAGRDGVDAAGRAEQVPDRG